MDQFDPRLAAQKFALMEHMAGMADNMVQNPRNQTPGMGSTANAVPYGNPIADARQQRLSEADYNALMSKLAGGAGMAMLPWAAANPFAALGAATGGVGAVAYDSARHYDEEAAKRLGYQGN